MEPPRMENEVSLHRSMVVLDSDDSHPGFASFALVGLLKVTGAAALLGLLCVLVGGEKAVPPPSSVFVVCSGLAFLFVGMIALTATVQDYRAKVRLQERLPFVVHWGSDAYQRRTVMLLHPPQDLDEKIVLALQRLVGHASVVDRPKEGLFQIHREREYAHGGALPSKARSLITVRRLPKPGGSVELLIESRMDEPFLPGTRWMSLDLDFGRSIENVEELLNHMRHLLVA